MGFLTQRGADFSGTCFNRWSRLESVITSERGLEERGCLPGAVWSPPPHHPPPPLLLKLKSQRQDTNPSMSKGRSSEEREDKTKKGILALSLTQPTLCSPAFQVLLNFLHSSPSSFYCFPLFSPQVLQSVCTLICSVCSTFLTQLPDGSQSCKKGFVEVVSCAVSAGSLCCLYSSSVRVCVCVCVCVQDFIVFPLNDRNSLHRKFLRLKGLEGSTFH